MTVDRTVPEVHLHIGSERRTTGGGGVLDHVFPATGEVQGAVPLAGPNDVDDAVQRRTRCVRRVADLDAVAAARRTRPARRPARARPRRTRPPVGPRQRHDVRDRPLHGHVGVRLHPLLRRVGRQDRRHRHVVACTRTRAGVHDPRAVRRDRDHHHLERSARVDRHEGDSGARRRKHGRRQAVGAHPVRDRALHDSRQAGRHPRRGREHAAGNGRRRSRPWCSTRSSRRSASPVGRRRRGPSSPTVPRA